ncbi:transcription antitermination factor NusB [Pseudogracilibacillus sp. ICA-222130]|uniref:transcription antitermination factor NusB n=1 Tax=Pseudogracilibacillus sp. ICA-222130 TaxID=3134655 RepID=UPI0030BC1280
MERRAAREEAFKLLFSVDLNEEGVTEEYIEDTFVKTIVHGVISYKEGIDHQLEEHLTNWTIDRIALVEKTILRIAIYEIEHIEDVPTAVSINEAVELAHKYGDEKSGKFINGVLAKLIK